MSLFSCFHLLFPVIFLIGKSTYTNVEVSSENLLFQVAQCISVIERNKVSQYVLLEVNLLVFLQHAIKTKFREGRRNPRKHLLDYSIDKFGQQLVDDIRRLRQIVILYLPVPFFWTLLTQSGSRWIFQAKRMNGDIGFYHLKPDQMAMVGAILLLIFVPLFETVVYPILKRFGVRRPLQKMAIGGFSMAVSFAIAGIVQFQVEASPKNTVHILWQLPQHVAFVCGEIMLALLGAMNCVCYCI